jgi:hypothetical protein
MQKTNGKDIDFSFNVVIQAPQRMDSIPPTSISNIKGLTELTHILCPAGVYFLVEGDEVVYVGQSVNPMARIGQHMKEKKGLFSRAFFIAVPLFMLDSVEGGFIKMLSPRLNSAAGPRAYGKEELARTVHPGLYEGQKSDYASAPHDSDSQRDFDGGLGHQEAMTK